MADDEVGDLVGAGGQPEGALRGVHPGQRGPLGDPGGSVHLDGLVDDPADPLGHHGFHGAAPHPGLGVAHGVHGPGGSQDHQPHGLDLDSGPGDHLHVLAQGGDGLPEGLAVQAPAAHELDGPLGGPD